MKPRRQKPQLASSGAVADINITPMVDVLLCLLIFVIVIQPGLIKGLDLQVPPPENAAATTTTSARDQLVLHVRKGPAYAINGASVPVAALGPKVHELFDQRSRKVLFVQGDEDVSYADVITAVDVVKGAGVTVVGLVPREVTARRSR